MVKFAVKLVVVAALGWAGYVAAQSYWTYFATRDAVDKALLEAEAKYRAPLRSGAFTEAMLDEVRTGVARVAEREGYRVDARDVEVSATAAGFSATVRYTLPLITHGGQHILAVPVSLERSPGNELRS